jgi:hypothetical protein
MPPVQNCASFTQAGSIRYGGSFRLHARRIADDTWVYGLITSFNALNNLGWITTRAHPIAQSPCEDGVRTTKSETLARRLAQDCKSICRATASAFA